MSDSAADVEKQTKDEGATWWCKLLARGIGVIAALIVGLTGVITLFSILHPICILSGCLMLGICCIMILLEAPFCCSFFESTKSISNWLTGRAYWQKGLLYIVVSIVPVAVCPGVTTFVGCVPPFATGVIYGLMSLGKKADRSEMMANARGGSTPQFDRFENETG
uniref:Calcium channel flower homolog n=1 Tax=Phallusia mammillata TaxID=59560 RepID=A0A6F9D8Q9_9ASCI|nr:calcium channel flower homolog [Phallusia mammillata]